MYTLRIIGGFKMEKMQEYLRHAFEFVSDIKVSGDDVEKMAEVRETLRRAYKLTEKQNKGEENNG